MSNFRIIFLCLFFLIVNCVLGCGDLNNGTSENNVPEDKKSNNQAQVNTNNSVNSNISNSNTTNSNTANSSTNNNNNSDNYSKNNNYEPGFFEEPDFGENPGTVNMYKYIPENLPAGPRPMVVALHGCSQTAEEYHDFSGWSDMANKFKFIVLYPEQTGTNQAMSCWTWYELSDSVRDSGEALSIKNMIFKMKEDYNISSSHIYVSGISAGAVMSAGLAVIYPDIFSGAAINSGIPFGCASSMMDSSACMSTQNYSPSEWAARAIEKNNYNEPGNIKWPRVLLWHGVDDFMVNIGNLTELMEQWTELHGIDQNSDSAETVVENTVKTDYKDNSGNILVSTYETSNMGHAVHVNPSEGCGDVGSIFFYDAGICTAYESAIFFGLDTF